MAALTVGGSIRSCKGVTKCDRTCAVWLEIRIRLKAGLCHLQKIKDFPALILKRAFLHPRRKTIRSGLWREKQHQAGLFEEIGLFLELSS